MIEAGPKWSRRKDARPGEIVEAALELFAKNGFAATKLTEVAEKAGVVKGTLYRYFDTKEELFRASVRHIMADNLTMVDWFQLAGSDLAELLPAMLRQVAERASETRLPAVVRMVLTESRNFPDLALIWHEEVISPILTGVATLIAQGQARGEIRDGDPRLHALSVIGPMVTGILYHEVFGEVHNGWPDLNALAHTHAETAVRGLRPVR